MVVFGQAVVGPPGSGKSTYCAGIQHFYESIGRECAVVNLDPANESVPYDASLDVRTLLTTADAAEKHSLGPNGALIFCMETLEANTEWLFDQLNALKGKYLILDFPGQVELFTHYTIVRNIVQEMLRRDFRLVAVNLVDSHCCSDGGKYISAMMLSLTTMLQLELPHVNVLSKIDLIELYGKLDFPLDTYTELNLTNILHEMDHDPQLQRYSRLNCALVDVLDTYNFLSFHALNIESKDSVIRVATIIDKANGYIYGNMDLSQAVTRALEAPGGDGSDWAVTIQERYVDNADLPPETSPSAGAES